jgi:acetyl esterase
MFAELGMDQVHTLPLPDFRATYRQNIGDLSVERRALASVEDQVIPGPAQPIPVRIYRPQGVSSGPKPLLLFFHGGGFVIGDLDTHDGICCQLTRMADCITVAVDYRLAPEHVFPAAVDDAQAALNWIAANASALGADPARIVVGGDSAGGNLAAVVALRAKALGGPAIALQVLAYPVTEQLDEMRSRMQYAEGYVLTREIMAWFTEQYLPDAADRSHPNASPLRVTELAGLPPALVITAGCDPLVEEGESYARRLDAAGVPVRLTRYEGTIHGFIGMYPVIDKGREALAEWAAAIRRL